MAKHLAGKVARTIGDFLTIGEIINLIDHEMEKKIVARHSLVKLDALLKLLPQLKNEIRSALPAGDKRDVAHLEGFISRLRKDLENSDLETGRDAFAAHSLRLDLMRIVDTWKCLGETTFGVLKADLEEIDTELLHISQLHPKVLSYPGAAAATVEEEWRAFWSHETNLGDPSRPRVANIYPGFATAGVVAPVPGGHPAQDASIRLSGLATFARQVRILLQAVPRASEAERLFAEMLLNDYFAMWELLFDSNVQNEHGQPDLSVVSHWRNAGFRGGACLAELENHPHPDLEKWRREVRNVTSAHVDADVDIWVADLKNWPMTIDTVINEMLRVIEAVRRLCKNGYQVKPFYGAAERHGPPRSRLSGSGGPPVEGWISTPFRRWSRC